MHRHVPPQRNAKTGETSSHSVDATMGILMQSGIVSHLFQLIHHFHQCRFVEGHGIAMQLDLDMLRVGHDFIVVIVLILCSDDVIWVTRKDRRVEYVRVIPSHDGHPCRSFVAV